MAEKVATSLQFIDQKQNLAWVVMGLIDISISQKKIIFLIRKLNICCIGISGQNWHSLIPEINLIRVQKGWWHMKRFAVRVNCQENKQNLLQMSIADKVFCLCIS